MEKRERKTGPAPARLAIDGDWREAVRKAIQIERPAEGWPDPDKKPVKRARKRRKPA